MSELAETVERLVREVLAEMGHTVAARSAEPPPPRLEPATGKQAPRPAGEHSDGLTIRRRVLTLAELPEKLDGVRQVIVPLGSVVTPLVREELQRRQIKLVEGESEPVASKQAVAILTVAATAYDSAPLAAVLEREGHWVESRREECLIRATGQLAADLASENAMGVLLTSYAAAAICLANRHSRVRAILGASDAVASDADAVGANLLVVNPSAHGFFAIKQMASRFLRTGPRQCPKVFRKELG